MGGDAKSPQHLSVHPMYVSYSSLSTATNSVPMKIPFLTVKSKQNNSISKTNILTSNDNNISNRNSIASFNRLSANPDIYHSAILPEESHHEKNYENNLDHIELNYLKNIIPLENQNIFHQNDSYIPNPHPNHTFDEDNVSDGIDSNDKSPFITEFRGSQSNVKRNPILEQHRHNHEIAENYKMPLHYITRSPNLNRISSRRRNNNEHPTINFCDKIREAPPGYTNQMVNIQRAKSQDRLTNRKQRLGVGDQKISRPRSYCSNSYTEEQFNEQDVKVSE